MSQPAAHLSPARLLAARSRLAAGQPAGPPRRHRREGGEMLNTCCPPLTFMAHLVHNVGQPQGMHMYATGCCLQARHTLASWSAASARRSSACDMAQIAIPRCRISLPGCAPAGSAGSHGQLKRCSISASGRLRRTWNSSSNAAGIAVFAVPPAFTASQPNEELAQHTAQRATRPSVQVPGTHRPVQVAQPRAGTAGEYSA